MKRLSPSHLDLNVDLLVEPAIVRRPLAAMCHFQIKVAKNLRNKRMELDQRHLEELAVIIMYCSREHVLRSCRCRFSFLLQK